LKVVFALIHRINRRKRTGGITAPRDCTSHSATVNYQIHNGFAFERNPEIQPQFNNTTTHTMSKLGK
jgi:hypothetical protein